jgi:hypothetical protein
VTCSTPVRPGMSAANESRSSWGGCGGCPRVCCPCDLGWRASGRRESARRSAGPRAGWCHCRPTRPRWTGRGTGQRRGTPRRRARAAGHRRRSRAQPRRERGGGRHRPDRMTACAQCTYASSTSTNVSAGIPMLNIPTQLLALIEAVPPIRGLRGGRGASRGSCSPIVATTSTSTGACCAGAASPHASPAAGSRTAPGWARFAGSSNAASPGCTPSNASAPATSAAATSTLAAPTRLRPDLPPTTGPVILKQALTGSWRASWAAPGGRGRTRTTRCRCRGWRWPPWDAYVGQPAARSWDGAPGKREVILM